MIIFVTHKTKQEKIKHQNASEWNYGWKNRNDRSACVNIFSEHLLTDSSSIIFEWIPHHIIDHTLIFIHWHFYITYTLLIHWLLRHTLIFTIHCSTRISFLEKISLLRNWNNRTNDPWGGLFSKSISLNEIFSFWKPKISSTEMFHESIEKQFNWDLMLRYTVKSTLLQYFMKYCERKISRCIHPLINASTYYNEVSVNG